MDLFRRLMNNWFGFQKSRGLKKRSRPARRHALPFSRLEPRHALAGNVFASVTDGNLLLGGDDADNLVEIRVVDGAVVVNGLDGTTVNGSTSFRVATGNTLNGKVSAFFYRGNDRLVLRSGVTVADSVEFHGGLGNDELGLEAVTVRGSVVANGDAGGDTVAMNGTTIRGTFRFIGGSGNDTLSLRSATINGSVAMAGGNGDDLADFQSSTLSGGNSLEMGKGNDSVRFESSTVSGSSRLSLGRGNDFVRSTTSTHGGMAVAGGSGNDNVEFSGSSGLPAGFWFQGGSGQDAITAPNRTALQSNQTVRGANLNGVDNALVQSRLNDPVNGIVARAAAAQATLRQVTNGTLSLTASLDGSQLLQSSGIQMTRNAAITISGTSLANATIDLARDGDGVFNDGTVTVGSNGQFSLPANLVSNATNLGVNDLVVRATDSAGNTLTQALKVHFAQGSVVRLASNRGNMDFELFDTAAPLTVANFKTYFQSWSNSIIHRSTTPSTAGLTVIQGGGFGLNGNNPVVLAENPAVASEFNASRSNVRGTLAMALRGGNVNSGTNQWFINLDDHSQELDPQRFTVFGRVIGDGLTVADGINDLPIVNLSPSLAANLNALSEVPLQNYTALSQNLAGTVSLTAGSNILTGTGTTFTAAANQSADGRIRVGTQTFTIDDVLSDTQIRLTANAGTTVTGQTAQISPTPTSANFVSFSSISELTFPQVS